MLLATISWFGLLFLVLGGWVILRLAGGRRGEQRGRFVKLLGLAAIVVGVLVFWARPSRHVEVDYSRPVRVQEIGTVDELSEWGESVSRQVQVRVHQEGPPRWVFISLGTGLVILGALMFGRGRHQPVAIKAATILGVGAILYAVIAFVGDGPRRAARHSRSGTVVVRSDHRDVSWSTQHEERDEPRRPTRRARQSRAKRPALRPHRPQPGERRKSEQLPPRAGEIPVSAELENQAQAAAAADAAIDDGPPAEPQLVVDEPSEQPPAETSETTEVEPAEERATDEETTDAELATEEDTTEAEPDVEEETTAAEPEADEETTEEETPEAEPGDDAADERSEPTKPTTAEPSAPPEQAEATPPEAEEREEESVQEVRESEPATTAAEDETEPPAQPAPPVSPRKPTAAEPAARVETQTIVHSKRAKPETAANEPAEFIAATADAERPAWVDALPGLADGVYSTPVSSGPFTTLPECQAALDREIKTAADQYIQVYLGDEASALVDIPIPYLKQHIKQAEFVERVQPKELEGLPGYRGHMYQIHALLEFDDQARADFRSQWRNAEVVNRLWYTGGGAALVLVLLSTLYGYLKLDVRTDSAHRGRLQLAATLVALIAVSGVLLALWEVL